MSYIIEIEIASDIDEFNHEKIKKNLIDGTINLAGLPKPNEPIGLEDGTVIYFEKCMLLQHTETQKHHALAIARPWTEKKVK